MTQFPERLRLDLPDALAGHREAHADLLERVVGSLADAGVTELHRQKSGGNLGRGVTQAYVARGMLVFAFEGSVLAQALDEKLWRVSGDPMLVARDVGGSEATSQAFAVSESTFVYRAWIRPVSQLTWLSRSGEPGRAIWDPGMFQSVQLSPDDKQAVASRSDGTKLLLWAIDLAGGAPLQLTLGSSSPVLWSPKGDRVWFRKPGGIWHDHIYSVLVDGGGSETLEVDQPDAYVAPIGWSATGSLLYTGYTMSGKSSFDLWELSSAGKPRMRIPAENANMDFHDAAVTPKGDLIAFAVGSGLYVQPVRGGGGRILVDRGRVASPRWRADGRELYYLSGGHLMAVAISGTTPVIAGTPQTRFEFHGAFYSPTRDGQRFLAAVPADPSDSNAFRVALNWTSLLVTSK